MSDSTPTCSTLLTPPGAGAIAVIRVVGPLALRCVDSVFRSPTGATLSDSAENRLRYGTLWDDDDLLDDVVACVIARDPLTVVEVCTHGGIRVVERVLTAFERRGVKVVESLDSLHSAFVETGVPFGDRYSVWPAANAIERDVDEALVLAKTERAVRFLANQRCLLPKGLIELIDRIPSDPGGVHTALGAWMSEYDSALRLIEGVTIALVGPPNAGKSALFNRLVGRDAVVVSPIEGTTRDWVSASLELEGVPITMLDTAGDRPAVNDAEQTAVEVGRSLWCEADLVLLVADVTRWRDSAYADAVKRLIEPERVAAYPVPRVLLVLNKADLVGSDGVFLGDAESADSGRRAHRVSSLTGSGVSDLMRSVVQNLGFERPVVDKACLFAVRQKDSASKALALPITDSDGLRRRLTQLLAG